MKIKICEIRDLMEKVCKNQQVPEKDIYIVVDHYLDGELRSKKTHGITKFIFESTFFHERMGDPYVVSDHLTSMVINGNKEIGPICANFATDEVIKKADQYGLGFVGVNNSQRYGVLSTWTEKIANKGYIGIVVNTSQNDASILGSKEGLLGVNPICFSFTTNESVITCDMSTTKKSMGYLWDCRRNNKKLIAKTFLNKQGEYTTNPFDAMHAEIFGGYKGFMISLLIQVLTGSVFGFNMGNEIKTFYDTGYCFIAIKPLVEIESFKQNNTKLINQIKSAQTVGKAIRVPGEKSLLLKEGKLGLGEINISKSTYIKILTLAKDNV